MCTDARPPPPPVALLTELILGALAGGLFTAGAHRLGARRERYVLAAGLVGAGLLYLWFAYAGGAAGAWLATEATSTAVFGLLALAGLWRWAGWIGVGWALHVLWDVLVHRGAGAPGYAPMWYPMACIGFDLTVAAWLLSHSRPT